MLTRPIPRTQEPLPVIGIGSYQTFDVGADAAGQGRTRAVLDEFVRAGGTLVDSSPMYGSAETVVGDSLHELGMTQKCFVATKVWTSGRAAGIQQMEDSLHKLGVNKLDLMQVHNLLDVATHLATLEEWKQLGRVRYVGITHYTAGAHSDVEKVLRSRPVDFVQINYSIAEREAERTLLPLAADRGVAVIVNRPFAGGALLRRLQRRALPACASELNCTSWAQLALKFILSHPAVTCVIPATSQLEHLKDYMAAGRDPMPTQSMREHIVEAAR